MTTTVKPDPTRLTTLATAFVEQEMASLAALQALLQPQPPPRSEAEIEADFDNLPV